MDNQATEGQKSDQVRNSLTPQGYNYIKSVDDEEFIGRFDIEKLLSGMSRHPFAILITLLIWLGIGTSATYYFLTTYQSEAVLVYQEDLNNNQSSSYAPSVPSLATAIDMIKLPINLQSVKVILGLDMSVRDIESMVDVPQPRANSTLIRINVRSSKPELAIDIANTLATSAVKTSKEFSQRQLQVALENLNKQLDISKQKLSAQLKNIEDFKTEHHYYDMSADNLVDIKQLTDARQRYQLASQNYISYLVEFENLKRETAKMPDLIEVPAQSAQIVRAGSQQQGIYVVEQSLADARAKYAPGNPRIVSLEAQLKEMQDSIDEDFKKREQEKTTSYQRNSYKDRMLLEQIRLQGKMRSALKIKQDLAVQLSELEKNLVDLPAKQVQFSKLLNEKKTTEDQITSLSNLIEKTSLMLNVPKGSVEIYQLADKAKPIRDNWWVDFLPLLTLFFGLPFGLLTAFFLEMQDDRYRTPKELELAYNLPCIGLMPEFAGLGEGLGEERTLFFIRSLADRLEQISHITSETGEKFSNTSFAILSSVKGEGKTTIAYCLSLYLKRLGKNVLLLQMDHHLGLHDIEQEYLPLEKYLSEKGLSLDSLIIKERIDKVRVGRFDAGIKELLKSKEMEALWKSLKERYEVLILDCPGVIDDAASSTMAKFADMGIFIVSSENTPKNVVSESLQALGVAGVRLCGLFLNKVMSVYIKGKRFEKAAPTKKLSWWGSFLDWFESRR